MCAETVAVKLLPHWIANQRHAVKIAFHRGSGHAFKGGFGTEDAGSPVGLRVKLAHCAEDGAAQTQRQGRAHFFFHQVKLVTTVAAKALVAAIAGKRDGDVLARQLADAVGGDGRAVGVGFVVELCQGVDEVEVVAFDHVEVVIGLVAVGYHFGEFGFVEGRVGKADRTGVDRSIRESGHDGDDGTRIDAAGKEGAERHFGNHPQADRLLEALREFGAGVGIADRVVQREADIPVFAGLTYRLTTAQEQGVGRRQFFCLLEDGTWLGYIAEGEVFLNGTGIDITPESTMGEQAT